jgi:hypothetical protein
MTPATCKSCNAAILWAETPNGKRMPLDAQPVPNGNIVLVDGKATVIGHGETRDGREAWLSHWATCPSAAQHRKPKEPSVSKSKPTMFPADARDEVQGEPAPEPAATEPAAATNGEPAPQPAAKAQPRRMSDELNAMVRLERILDELEPAAQSRVLCWLADRYAQQIAGRQTP